MRPNISGDVRLGRILPRVALDSLKVRILEIIPFLVRAGPVFHNVESELSSDLHVPCVVEQLIGGRAKHFQVFGAGRLFPGPFPDDYSPVRLDPSPERNERFPETPECLGSP